jgi:UDP-perosamine 4-acetyltransferase
MGNMKEVVIFGAGNQGRVVLEVLRGSGRSVRAFVDDARAASSNAVSGVPVWPKARFPTGAPFSEVDVFVAVGNNDVRIGLTDQLRADGYRVCNAVHSSAVVSPSARLGDGVLVCALSFVGVETTVADDAVLNTRCSVDHDCVIGRGAYLSPGVTSAGRVTVAERAFVGLGAMLGPNVEVGAGAIVAAGAVVLDHVPPCVLAAGVPARIVRRIQAGVDWGRVLAREPRQMQERD